MFLYCIFDFSLKGLVLRTQRGSLGLLGLEGDPQLGPAWGLNVYSERALGFLGLLLGLRRRKQRVFRDRPTGNTLTEMLP